MSLKPYEKGYLLLGLLFVWMFGFLCGLHDAYRQDFSRPNAYVEKAISGTNRQDGSSTE